VVKDFMTDFKKVLGRIDIQLFCSYLLNGVGEPGEQDARTYKQRIQEDERPIYELLEQLFPDENELEKAADRLRLALEANQEVFLELGMKAGAQFLLQLLQKGQHE
jgi:hypothetical protein